MVKPEPITLTSPTVEDIVAQAQARGMGASQMFPLESDTRYAIMSLQVDKGLDLDVMSSGIEAVEGVNVSTLVGDHVTMVAPSGKQVEAQMRIKIRLGSAPQEEVLDI